MAQIEVPKASSGRIPTEDLRSLEISPETEKRLRLLQWSINLARSLREKTLKTGDLLAEYRKEALLAATGFTLTALAACSQAEGDVKIPPVESQYKPTAPRQSIEALPSTQTPIIDSRQTREPALTPVETQTPSPLTPEPTQIPEVIEKQASSRFDRLREKIDQSTLKPAQKQESQFVIDQFEKADQVLQRFINAYEAQKEPDGTPTLMKLTKQRFHNMDLAPYWQGRYASEQDFWESQIFFLADKKYLDNILTKVLAPQTTPRETNDILNSHYRPDGKVIDPKLDRYLQVASKQTPGVQFSPSAEIDEQTTKIIEETLAKFPFIGSVEVRINPQKSLDDIGGDINIKDDIAILNLSSYKLGSNMDEWEYATLHEAAHSLDHNLNFYARERLLHYLTPEQFVRLYITQEKAMADSEVGRNYPDISKLFQVDRKRTARSGEKKPYDARGFSQTSSLFADARFISQTKEWYEGPLKAPIFGKEFLPDGLTNQFVAEYKAKGEEKASLSARIPLTPEESRWLKDHTFVWLSEFLEAEKDKLDQLAASNKYWGVVIKSLRENPQRFEGFKWLGGFPRLAPIPVEALSATSSTWWTTLSTWGNLIFLEGFFQNDPQIIGLFTPEEKKRIIEQIITLTDVADREKFADSLALTISSQSRDFGGRGNPFQTLLDLAWQIRSEAKAGIRE